MANFNFSKALPHPQRQSGAYPFIAGCRESCLDRTISALTLFQVLMFGSDLGVPITPALQRFQGLCVGIAFYPYCVLRVGATLNTPPVNFDEGCRLYCFNTRLIFSAAPPALRLVWNRFCDLHCSCHSKFYRIVEHQPRSCLVVRHLKPSKQVPILRTVRQTTDF